MDVFAMAERAEHYVAEIYELLAERFSGEPELSELFEALADEERGHAKRVREVAAEWRADGDWQPGRDLLRVRDLAEEAEALLATLSDQEEMPVNEAIDLAGQLEDHFHEVHAQILAGQEAPELAELFTELAKHDQAHELLQARRGQPASRTRA